MPQPHIVHLLLVSSVCILLTSCLSESAKNPFDVSGFSVTGSKEPFSSTVYPEPDILTEDSATTYQQATYQGQVQRLVYDGRSDNFSTIDAYVYSIAFTDGNMLEAIVNAEFANEASANAEAERFGRSIGQLPAVLRSEVEHIWIHKGRVLWGSVNKALYVHTDMTSDYQSAQILEETLLHESVHIALDEDHENTPQWKAAQISDDNYISTYAKDNAETEDLAESFLMWMASRYMTTSLSTDNLERIVEAIPARLVYLNQQNFDMSPVGP